MRFAIRGHRKRSLANKAPLFCIDRLEAMGSVHGSIEFFALHK